MPLPLEEEEEALGLLEKTRRTVAVAVLWMFMIGLLVLVMYLQGMTPARVWNGVVDWADGPECHIDEDCPEPLP